MLKLAVFDLDGTLKQAPDPYIYLHECLGTLEAAEAFTVQGLSGEISSDEWLRLDTGLWTGVSRSVLVKHLRNNPYLTGARETVSALKERGIIVAIVSSGLLLHAQMVAEELGIGPVVGNEVLFEGDEVDPMVSGQVQTHCAYGAKRPVLESLQAQLGVLPAETLAVGDTRSDLGLFECAAVSVAVNPNHPQVAAAADIVLADADLRPLLDLLHDIAPHLW